MKAAKRGDAAGPSDLWIPDESANRSAASALRLLFQEHAIPPLRRERLPCVFEGERLVAVGDVFIDHDFRHWLHAHGAQLRWTQD